MYARNLVRFKKAKIWHADHARPYYFRHPFSFQWFFIHYITNLLRYIVIEMLVLFEYVESYGASYQKHFVLLYKLRVIEKSTFMSLIKQIQITFDIIKIWNVAGSKSHFWNYTKELIIGVFIIGSKIEPDSSKNFSLDHYPEDFNLSGYEGIIHVLDNWKPKGSALYCSEF